MAKKRGVCFVATAALDDPDHPDIVLLRAFRDKWLARQRWSQAYIRWYYRNGPKLAAIIALRPVLQKLACILIVTPAAWLAKKILRKP